MKSIIIHGGPHKTGSTAIQDFCHLNREKLLEEKIYYPRGLLFENGHHEIPELIVNTLNFKEIRGMKIDSYLSNLLSEFIELEAEVLLLSSEQFVHLSAEHFAQIMAIGQRFGVERFSFIRFSYNPDNRVDSYINELVKSGEHITEKNRSDLLSTLVDNELASPLRDNRLKQIGFEVRVLDFEVCRAEDDIFRAFFGSFDALSHINSTFESFLNYRANRSLPKAQIERLNQFNRLNRNEMEMDKLAPVVYSDRYPVEKQRLKLAILIIGSKRGANANIKWIVTSRTLSLILKFRSLDVIVLRVFGRIYGG